MIQLKATDYTLVDIISFFLYDNESIDELYNNYVRIEYKQRRLLRTGISYWTPEIKGKSLSHLLND